MCFVFSFSCFLLVFHETCQNTVQLHVITHFNAFTFCISFFKAQESADLIFLIDGSNNIGSVNFPAIRDFLVNLIESLRVGAQQIHIGVVQYSDEPRTEFALNSYSTKADVLDAVKALSFRGGEEANIGAALEFVVENLFTQAGGSRIEEAVPQILVLISGGESSDDIREGLLAVKQASIFSFSIGVQNADSAELQQIATDGSFAFTALDIRNLDALQELLLPNIVGVAQRLILLEAPTIVTEGMYAFLDCCILMNFARFKNKFYFLIIFAMHLSGLILEKMCN